MPQREDLLQQAVGLRPAAVVELPGELVPDVGVVGEHPGGHGVGVVGGDGDQAVVVGGWASRKSCGSPASRSGVTRMRRTSSRMTLLNSWSSSVRRSFTAARRARGVVVAVDAGAGEVAQGLLEQPDRVAVETVGGEPGEHLVEPTVEGEVGEHPHHVGLGLLGGGAHLLVGVHVAEQRAHRRDVAEGEVHLVPLPQHRQRLGRRVVAQSAHQRGGLAQSFLGAGAHPLLEGARVVGGRQGERLHALSVPRVTDPAGRGAGSGRRSRPGCR